MPFEAAKAVAATFCYDIRYALTPVFGLDFLSLCIAPDDPSFGRMVIDRNIVQQCTEQAIGFRLLSREGSLASSPRTIGSPDEFFHTTPKSLRPKFLKGIQGENDSGSDADPGDNYLYSPQIPPNAEWVALNAPRSVNYVPFTPGRAVSPYPSQAERTYRSEVPSSSDGNRLTKRLRPNEHDGNDDKNSSSQSSLSSSLRPREGKPLAGLSMEVQAAHILMQMHVDDAKLACMRSRTRRAST